LSVLRGTALEVAERELRRRRGALAALADDELAAIEEVVRAVALGVTEELLEPLETGGGDPAAPAVRPALSGV
jgi:hypothetical protein